MKKVVFGLVAAATLTACNSAPRTAFAPQGFQPQVRMMAANSQSPDTAHHPDFVRKLQDPANYTFRPDNSRSICGKNDLQHVNDYDGSLGPSVQFVRKHQGAVGALAMGSPGNTRKFCTGTMISEDLFLTASHCIGRDITSNYAVFNYEKANGTNSPLPEEAVRILEVVEDGEANGGRLDYAILRLEGKPGRKYGMTGIKAYDVAQGNRVNIIQHPRGQMKQVEAGPTAGLAGVYFRYADLDTEPGSSGSGVLDNDGFIVGVHTNGGCYSSGGANKGVRMSEIAKVSGIVQQMSQASGAAMHAQRAPRMSSFNRFARR